MKRIKKFLLSFISAMLIATMFTSNLNALDINSEIHLDMLIMKQINLKLIVMLKEVLEIIQA